MSQKNNKQSNQTAKSQLCIAQISDCHLLADRFAKSKSVSPFVNLKQVVIELYLRQDELDAILLTGDLVDGDNLEQAYELLLQLIDGCDWQIPIFATPGNHDDPELMKRLFADSCIQLVDSAELSGWLLLFVDSYQPQGIGVGEITQSQLDNAEHVLSKSSCRQALFVTHHHVAPFSSFIDDCCALSTPAGFTAWLKSQSTIKAIVHGHVHSNKTYQFANKSVFAGPSTWVQFGHDKHNNGDVVDTHPSYQLLYLGSDGKVSSDLFIIDG